MRQTMVYCCVAALVGAVLSSRAFGVEPGIQVVVRADRPGTQISPTMYGVFFEDINFGADGGCTRSWSRTAPSNSPRPGWAGARSNRV